MSDSKMSQQLSSGGLLNSVSVNCWFCSQKFGLSTLEERFMGQPQALLMEDSFSHTLFWGVSGFFLLDKVSKRQVIAYWTRTHSWNYWLLPCPDSEHTKKLQICHSFTLSCLFSSNPRCWQRQSHCLVWSHWALAALITTDARAISTSCYSQGQSGNCYQMRQTSGRRKWLYAPETKSMW